MIQHNKKNKLCIRLLDLLKDCFRKKFRRICVQIVKIYMNQNKVIMLESPIWVLIVMLIIIKIINNFIVIGQK
jgi:hypothetical protein